MSARELRWFRAGFAVMTALNLVAVVALVVGYRQWFAALRSLAIAGFCVYFIVDTHRRLR